MRQKVTIVGAGMTGGRAYLYDPDGRTTDHLNGQSVLATRLVEAIEGRPDGLALRHELERLVVAHATEGSETARSLGVPDPARFWLVEPVGAVATPALEASDVGAGVAVRPMEQPVVA